MDSTILCSSRRLYGLWLLAAAFFFSTTPLWAQSSDSSSVSKTSVSDDGTEADEQQEGLSVDESKGITTGKAKYMGRRIAPTMSYAHAGWLVRDVRQQEEDTQQALDNLGLQPGMVVCDMGCGNGYYSLEIAKRVAPGGKVLAVDIQQEMLHLLHLRAEEAKIDNIETILGTVVNPDLPAGVVDLMLMVDVYHEFSHPEEMLAAIRQSLSPKGRIALVEFRAEDPRVPILPLHKMSKRQILREYKANGFKLVEEYDQLPWQHLMFFEKEQ